MKYFIKDCVIYFSLLFATLFGIKSSVPYHWGNEEFTRKINHINASEEKYNSLAIGSSMFYRHFSPIEFSKNNNTNLFNLGTTALFFSEASYLYEHFLDESVEKTKNPRNLFFLIQTPIPFNKNIHTIRGTYYLDFKRYVMAVRYYFPNYDQVFKYTKGFLENKLCMGQIKSMILFHFKENEIEKFHIAQRGFYSMDDQLRREKTPSLQNLKNNFQKNPKIKENQLRRNIIPPGFIEDPKERIYKTEINRLKKISKEKNVSLISVYLPNLFYGFEKGDKNTIFLGTGKTFPEYFQPENRFEQGHLNKKGAKLFSKRLAKEYSKLKNSKIELSYF